MEVEMLPVDSDADTCSGDGPTLSNPSQPETLDSSCHDMEIDISTIKSPSDDITMNSFTFHLSVTRTMGNRTLPVKSSEWRELRSRILIRDNRTCATCKYVSPDLRGRGMKIDHTDGDASNNDPANLRIHCPPCEAIRHCGLHGMKGYILLATSDLGQVEIVRKTREFLEKHGRMPQVREIEPRARPANMTMVDFANILLEVDWDDLPQDMRRFRGFFNRRAEELFSVTTLQRGGNVADPAHLRALEILQVEKSLPWVRFSIEEHGSLLRFLDTYRPSSTKQSDVAWICIHNSKIQQSDENSDVVGLCRAWDDSCNNHRSSASELDRLSLHFGVLSGKWLVFAHTSSVDNLWSRIVRATDAGTLGNSAKVSPYDEADPSGRHVICVYTSDYTNEAEVNKVREGLRRLGVKDRIGYKPDVYTYCKVYANNKWNITPTRYHA